MSELKWGELRPAEFENLLCSKHGYAVQICCLYVADGRQRSVYAISGKSIRTTLKWSVNKKTRLGKDGLKS